MQKMWSNINTHNNVADVTHYQWFIIPVTVRTVKTEAQNSQIKIKMNKSQSRKHNMFRQDCSHNYFLWQSDRGLVSM